MFGGGLTYAVYSKLETQLALCETYNNILKEYTADTTLNSNQVLAVGDSHGSLLQIVYPLIRGGLIKNVRFPTVVENLVEKVSSMTLDFEVSDTISTCPTVVFLGDVFHKTKGFISYNIMFNMLKIKEAIDKACKTVGCESKFIILLGNHDLIQYTHDKCVVTKTNLDFIASIYRQFCTAEFKCGKMLGKIAGDTTIYIKTFIKAVDNRIIKMAYVDKYGNLYSHTVANSDCLEAEYIPDHETSTTQCENLKHIITTTKIKDKSPVEYNEQVCGMYNEFIEKLKRTDIKYLVSYINSMWDRPTKAFQYAEGYQQLTDIASPKFLHIVGHTQMYKRFPVITNETEEKAIKQLLKDVITYYETNIEDAVKIIDYKKSLNDKLLTNIEETKRSIVELLDKISKNIIEDKATIINIISTLRLKFMEANSRYENILCCDSQILTEGQDMSYLWNTVNESIYTIGKKYIGTTELIRYIVNDTFEQPTFYIVENTKSTIVYGPLLMLTKVYSNHEYFETKPTKTQ